MTDETGRSGVAGEVVEAGEAALSGGTAVVAEGAGAGTAAVVLHGADSGACARLVHVGVAGVAAVRVEAVQNARVARARPSPLSEAAELARKLDWGLLQDPCGQAAAAEDTAAEAVVFVVARAILQSPVLSRVGQQLV